MKTAIQIILGLGCLSIFGLAGIFLWVLISNAFFKGPNSPEIIWDNSQAVPYENQNQADLWPCCSENWRTKYPSQDSDEKHGEQRNSKGILEEYGSIPAYQGAPKKEVYGFVTQSGHFNGCRLYQCTVCLQIWAYSEPDNAWRGYFKPIKNIEEARIRKLR